MFTKQISIKQLLDSRDELIELMFHAILQVKTASRHLRLPDLMVKEIYGFWGKILILEEGDNYVFRMNSLGFSWNIYYIPTALIGMKEGDAPIFRNNATQAIDAWISRRIKVALRQAPFLCVGEDAEDLHAFADRVKEIYPSTIIHVSATGFSYHCMTRTGQLLTSTTQNAGPLLSSEAGRQALAKLEGYDLYATANVIEEDISNCYTGVANILNDLVVTDFTNLIMIGEEILLDTKINYNDR